MGRATYEEMAGFWAYSDDEYAAPMNDIPKMVFSKTLTKAGWPHLPPGRRLSRPSRRALGGGRST